MNYYIPKKLPKSFLDNLNLGPVLKVPIQPMESGKPIYCLDNVKRYLAYNPGSIQYGWIFSMLGSVIIKLHGHVVVKDKSGALFCVTPPEATLEYHNFVPDDSVADLVVNQRLPTRAVSLVNNKVVNSLVDLENKFDQARLSDDQFGLDEVCLEKQKRKAEFIRSIKQHTGRNDPCYCGSGRKNKQCCQ
ncbi:YecA family protein [Gynuella sunshinyii]|uniref:YecA family protein n=1 Tax=Gynuella sunshinyii TaxID=1445505 RepID=UPI0005CB8717|nr:SEC-C metal-binding domain-containing protein [Gynuella sunshinyii]